MDNIKKWYKTTHPEDELGDDINKEATFSELQNVFLKLIWKL